MVAVKHYIAERKMSYAEFAKLLGVDRSHLSHLFAGDRHPSVQLLRRMHEVTGINVKTLLYECT